MATNQITGYGTKFQRFTGSDYVDIAEVTTIEWEGASRNVIEVALLDPDDDYVNKIQGLIDAGSMTVNLGYTIAGFLQMKTDFETRGDQTYRVLFPDNAALEFDGFVSQLPLNFDPAAPLDGSFVVQINGKADYISAVV